MRVVVIGSGVIGTTTAYYLSRAGHEVVVLDRQTGPALETSFANAGQISPSLPAPWAGPGMPLKSIGLMTQRFAPLVIRARLDPEQLKFLWRMYTNCNAAAYERNKARMLRVAMYSRDKFGELRAETGIRYDDGQRGTLEIYRTQKQMDAAAGDLAGMAQAGIPHRLLDRQGCIAVEPALAAVADKIVGGLHMPADETGDCFLFTNRLSELATAAGVEFRFNTEVRGLATTGDAVTGVETAAGRVSGDAYVVAAGSYSTSLLRALGLELPVFPVKGYSITVPVTDAARAPVSTLIDETYKAAITRLGERIRVGGTAELTGFDLRLRDERRATVEFVLQDLFPGAGDPAQGSFWCGLRPMTPDGTPVIGPTRLRGLYLNTGHGTFGWTMSVGSAALLADLISGRTPDIDAADLALSRYGR